MVADELPANVEIAELDGEVTSVLSYLQQADVAVLVDACRCGVPAGSVQRFDLAARRLPQDGFAVSTHGVSIANALELARTLGELPAICIVYGIEAEGFDPGADLSAPVASVLPEVARRVRAEFEHLQVNGGPIDA